MKRIAFWGLFFGLTVSAFGQQFLWSTVQGNDTRYVSLNNVTREVVKFYEQYKYYSPGNLKVYRNQSTHMKDHNKQNTSKRRITLCAIRLKYCKKVKK